MQHNSQLRGIFPDITANGGNLYISYAQNGVFRVDVFDPRTGTIANFWNDDIAGEDFVGNGYGRIKNIAGNIWITYTNAYGQKQYVVHIGNTSVPYPGRFELFAGALGNNGFGINDSNSVYRTRNYSFGDVLELPQLSVQGLAYIKDDQYPVGNDDNRPSVPGMYNPARAGRLVCGEGLSGGTKVQDEVTGKFITIAEFTTAYKPFICTYTDVNGHERYAIVTGDYNVINMYYDISIEDVIGDVVEPPIPIPPNPTVIHVKYVPGLTIIVD